MLERGYCSRILDGSGLNIENPLRSGFLSGRGMSGRCGSGLSCCLGEEVDVGDGVWDDAGSDILSLSFTASLSPAVVVVLSD